MDAVVVDALLSLGVLSCRAINALLRRWLPASLVSLRVAILTLEQPLLRTAAVRQLRQLPRTGIHGLGPIDCAQFGRFCTHAFKSFRNAPRTKLLRGLALRLSVLRGRCSDVDWLMSRVLAMPKMEVNSRDRQAAEDDIVNENDLIKALRCFESLPRGGKHELYEAKLARSREPSAVSPALRERMTGGIARKLGCDKADAAVSTRISDIERERERVRQEAAATAATLLRECGQDATYRTWKRAQAVWKRHVAPLLEELRQSEREVGEKRSRRGTGFEEWARRDAFEMVSARLMRSRPLGTVLRRLDNVEWVDRQGKHVGEVDAVVLADCGGARREMTVLALLELKAHCLDVPTGWWQQVRHQHAHNYLHLVSDSNLSALQESDKPGGKAPPVFVVTTLPPNRHVMGCSMEIVQRLGSFFGNEYRGISPKAFPHERDPVELAGIAETLRNEFLSGPPEMRAAPVDFIAENNDSNVLFIV